MRKLLLGFIIVLLFSSVTLKAQENPTRTNDDLLKETLFNANKVKVLNFSLKEFDALFFEFFDKKSRPELILSKEEFYNYTVQIAIFSDRLAALYPEQKEIAAVNKKKWLAETYEDYLLSKATEKK